MRKLIQSIIKKSWWVTKEQAEKIQKEALRTKTSESALMRHIISQWFEK